MGSLCRGRRCLAVPAFFVPAWNELLMRSRCVCWGAARLGALCCARLLARGAPAQPTVTHVLPGAVTPGKTTEITVVGTKLAGPLKLWASFPAQVEWVSGEAQGDVTEARCKLTLSAGVSAGLGGLAVSSKSGVSDVTLVMIDDLPSVAEEADNHSLESAQAVALPAAIDGRSDGTLADFYRFKAAAGQRLSCEVVAARLGWDFDAVVRVLDAGGKELLLDDDDSATGADARFVFTAPADASYVLEVRDNRYKPGGRYRLRLGEMPLVSVARPLVAQRGAVTMIDFAGPRVEETTPVALAPVSGEGGFAALAVAARGLSGAGAGWASVGTTELAVNPESALKDDAKVVSLPCFVAGELSAAKERDTFEFAANKGMLARFRALTASLGSPAVVTLQVLDAGGKVLASSPTTTADEPVLNFTVPADGKYRLAVEELAGRGGRGYGYAVECRRGEQFDLQLKNDKNNKLRYSTPIGGAFYLDVVAARAGYSGAIHLSVQAERPGWQLVNGVIPARANEARVYVLPPVDFAAGDAEALRIVGRGEVNGAIKTATMTTTLQLRASRPQVAFPPAWQDGAVFVAGIGAKPAFYALTQPQNVVSFEREKGEGRLTIAMQRKHEKFKDAALVIVPLGLPAGVTAEVKRNGNGPHETYDIVLKGLKPLADGEHAFRYFAYGEMSGQGRGVMSGDVRLVAKIDETKAASEAKVAGAKTGEAKSQ